MYRKTCSLSHTQTPPTAQHLRNEPESSLIVVVVVVTAIHSNILKEIHPSKSVRDLFIRKVHSFIHRDSR